ncbi:restriction endonuclease, partial [Shewanella baltica]|uniref:restriction endonuclease n=1 Tax=Shewanella baltica TaxID=62322 RepID=UPI003D7B1282
IASSWLFYSEVLTRLMGKLIGDADQICGYGFSSTYLGNKALYGVKNSRSGGNVGIIVTTSTFTSEARKFIENEATTNLDLTLADKEQLLEWLKGYGKN